MEGYNMESEVAKKLVLNHIYVKTTNSYYK